MGILECTHIMVDIETLSTEHNAAILTIGACVFHPREAFFGSVDEGAPFDESEEFYKRVNVESNERAARKIDISTIKWWMEQSEKAKTEAFYKAPRVSLFAALETLQQFMVTHMRKSNGVPLCVWAKDPDFDLVILADAMRHFSIEVPWHFTFTRSVRTIYSLAPGAADTYKPRIAHNAMEDAKAQAMNVVAVLKAIGNAKAIANEIEG